MVTAKESNEMLINHLIVYQENHLYRVVMISHNPPYRVAN